MATRRSAPVPVEDISRSILILRRQRVILDADLAVLYGVPTKALNQAVQFRCLVVATRHIGNVGPLGGPSRILSAIRELTNPSAPKRGGIGFTANIDEKL